MSMETSMIADVGLAVPASGLVNPSDLAELVAAFTSVTGRLQATHETLRAEVARLQGELGRANEQLERSRRLAALGEMAAGIAHEVRNPLASIGLYARMLRQDLAEGSPPRGLAEKIGRAVRDLDAVVGDVLAFARECRVRPLGLDASEVLTKAHDAVAAEFAGLGAVVLRPDLARPGMEFDGDPGLLHTALVNVIRNAYQAMSEAVPGGHQLELDALHRASDSGERVVLRVADTGPGVSAETVERMFNPFFTTRATGTGLGLAIVHRIADTHGGTVSVRSPAPGQTRGTVVELAIPVRWGGATPADRNAALHHNGPGSPPAHAAA
jgi:signal transduction histidine kinase